MRSASKDRPVRRPAGAVAVLLWGAAAACGGGGGKLDRQPPTVPDGLVATAVSTSRIDLAWNPSSDDVGVTGYRVYRDGFFLEAIVAPAARLTGLAPGSTFCYRVAARDGAGRESAPSAEACATTQAAVGFTIRNRGSHYSLTAIGWDGGRWLVSADDGANLPLQLTSPDAIRWTARSSANPLPPFPGLVDLLWDGRQWLAVDRFGWVDTSADGIAWNRNVAIPRLGALRAIAWSGSRCVAVGENGQVLASADGAVWTAPSSGTGAALLDVTWAGHHFVAVGMGGTILTSPDGAVWSPQVSGTAADLVAVAWSGSKVVALGRGASAVSEDGAAWTSAPLAAFSPGDVAWSPAAGLFVAVEPGGLAFTSPDGKVWTERARLARELIRVTEAAGTVVAVGADGEIASSADALRWTNRASGSMLHAVAWTGRGFVAVGELDGRVFTSPDGISWSVGSVGDPRDRLFGVASSGAAPLVVAVGQGYAGGAAWVSQDGVVWSADSTGPGPQPDLRGVTWGAGTFVAVGGSASEGLVYRRPDGAGWSKQTSGTVRQLWSVAWSGSLFAAVGAGGTILTSPDASSWTVRSSGTGEDLRAIAFARGQFVAVGANTTILTSPDGISWAVRASAPGSPELDGVGSDGSTLYAVGGSDALLASQDGGETWSQVTRFGSPLHAIAWSGSRLALVGEDGLIVTRD